MRALRNSSRLGLVASLVAAACTVGPAADAQTPFEGFLVDDFRDTGQYTAIAINSRGEPIIAYHDVTATNLKLARRIRGVWEVENVDLRFAGAFVSIALDSKDRVHLCYYAAGAEIPLYAFEVDGEWVTELIESPPRDELGAFTSIDIDENDNPVVSYYDFRAGGFDLRVARRINGIWQPETVDSEGDTGLYSSLHYSSGGEIWVAYLDAEVGDLRFARGLPDGSWELETVDQDGFVGTHTSITESPAGGPIISYYDIGNQALKLAAYLASTWQVATIDTGNVGEFTSIAVDDGDDLWISYYDRGNTALKLATRRGGTWGIETVDSSGAVGRFSSIALGPYGNPKISYYDEGLGALRMVDGGIELVHPLGGDRWAAESTQPVEWIGAGSVRLEISDDDGATYRTLAEPVSGGAVEVFVPLLETESGRVRVVRDDPFALSEAPGNVAIAPDLVSPWWSETVDADGFVGRYASLVLDRDGEPCIGYQDISRGDLLYAEKRDGGWTRTRVFEAGTTGSDVNLALTPDGHPVLCFRTLDEPGLFFVARTDTGWAFETVDESVDGEVAPALAVDSLGQARLIYYDVAALQLRYAVRRGGAWEITDVTRTAPHPSGIALTLARDGEPRVAFWNTNRFRLEVASHGSGGWTFDPVEVGNEAATGVAIALDESDVPYLAFRGLVGGQLWYSSRRSGEWRTELVDESGDVGPHVSLAMDEEGSPWIAYPDVSTGTLRVATERRGVWTLEAVDVGGKPGTFASLALDRTGNARIAHFENETGVLRYTSRAIEIVREDAGEWPVGSRRTVGWRGTGQVRLLLRSQDGAVEEILGERLLGGEQEFVVPSFPDGAATLEISRLVPFSESASSESLRILAGIILLEFTAEPLPDAPGVRLAWQSRPGPEDLDRYRLERMRRGGDWTPVTTLSGETQWLDADGRIGDRYRLFAVNGLGEETLLGSTVPAPGARFLVWPQPLHTGLLDIGFAVPAGSGASPVSVRLQLYDARGRRLRTLHDVPLPAGFHTATWDGTDAAGRMVASGLYFLQLRIGNERQRLKVVVTR